MFASDRDWAMLHPWGLPGNDIWDEELRSLLWTTFSDSLYWSEKIMDSHVPVLLSENNTISFSKRCTIRATLVCSDRQNRSPEQLPALPQTSAVATLSGIFKHSSAATQISLQFELLFHFVRDHLPFRNEAGITSENRNQKALSIL